MISAQVTYSTTRMSWTPCRFLTSMHFTVHTVHYSIDYIMG